MASTAHPAHITALPIHPADVCATPQDEVTQVRSVVTTLEQKVTFLQTTIEERTQETLTATSRLVRMLSLTHTHTRLQCDHLVYGVWLTCGYLFPTR